jgi:hypothetical protein
LEPLTENESPTPATATHCVTVAHATPLTGDVADASVPLIEAAPVAPLIFTMVAEAVAEADAPARQIVALGQTRALVLMEVPLTVAVGPTAAAGRAPKANNEHKIATAAATPLTMPRATRLPFRTRQLHLGPFRRSLTSMVDVTSDSPRHPLQPPCNE